MTESNYFVAVDGKTSGPFKGQQIRNKLNQGKLLKSDSIWREGMTEWLPISEIISEIPGVNFPALPEQDAGPRSMLMEHPNELPPTEVEIPPKGIYEPPATLSQKNTLMKFGCKNPETLRRLGRDQASFMINAFEKDALAFVQYEAGNQRKESTKAAFTVGVILLILALLAAIVCGIYQLNR
jgi:hypothetical protein